MTVTGLVEVQERLPFVWKNRLSRWEIKFVLVVLGEVQTLAKQSDQDTTSLYIINTMPNREVMRITKIINLGALEMLP